MLGPTKDILFFLLTSGGPWTKNLQGIWVRMIWKHSSISVGLAEKKNTFYIPIHPPRNLPMQYPLDNKNLPLLTLVKTKIICGGAYFKVECARIVLSATSE